MKTIHAVYENGVFRPTTPVDLPDGSRVTVQPESPEATRLTNPNEDDLDPVYEVLSRSYRTGETDLAARHNEHQP